MRFVSMYGFAIVVGVVSGVYIFKEPLESYASKRTSSASAKREPRP